MKIYKVGRALFGGYFIYSGINHFMKKNELAQYAGAKQVPKPETLFSVGLRQRQEIVRMEFENNRPPIQLYS